MYKRDNSYILYVVISPEADIHIRVLVPAMNLILLDIF